MHYSHFQFRPLQSEEKIEADDFVEDLASGQLIQVGAKGSPYNYLRRQRAGQARQVPYVFNVVRRV